jgi:hypothetical protein
MRREASRSTAPLSGLRVTFVACRLGQGGAERQLSYILKPPVDLIADSVEMPLKGPWCLVATAILSWSREKALPVRSRRWAR